MPPLNGAESRLNGNESIAGIPDVAGRRPEILVAVDRKGGKPVRLLQLIDKALRKTDDAGVVITPCRWLVILNPAENGRPQVKGRVGAEHGQRIEKQPVIALHPFAKVRAISWNSIRVLVKRLTVPDIPAIDGLSRTFDDA